MSDVMTAVGWCAIGFTLGVLITARMIGRVIGEVLKRTNRK